MSVLVEGVVSMPERDACIISAFAGRSNDDFSIRNAACLLHENGRLDAFLSTGRMAKAALARFCLTIYSICHRFSAAHGFVLYGGTWASLITVSEFFEHPLSCPLAFFCDEPHTWRKRGANATDS